MNCLSSIAAQALNFNFAKRQCAGGMSHTMHREYFERIMNGGQNPKTGNVYVLDDVTNPDYRQAVEDYILENTEGI